MNQTLSHDLDQLCINTARILSVDMSEKAHSGHPGLPLGAAPMAYTLWDRFCGIIPPTLGGPIATVSSSPLVMDVSCFTHCFI
jgi:hypothetical protein